MFVKLKVKSRDLEFWFNDVLCLVVELEDSW